MLFKLASVIVLACTTFALQVTEPSSKDLSGRINAGGLFNSQGFDYIVYISRKGNASKISGCTGVLISSRHVLTQQSCLGLDPISDTVDYANLTVVVSHTDSSNRRTPFNARVSRVYQSDQFTNGKFPSNIALLRLNAVVPESVAKPARIYAGDYKLTTPATLAGYATVGTQNSSVSASKMRFEKITIQDNMFCLGANRLYNKNTDLCSQVMSGLNTCKADLGAPILVPVDNGGRSNGNDTKTFALLALASSTNIDSDTGCEYTGSTGFYSWVYPFIDQISDIVGLNTTQITLVNNTQSSTSDAFLHPDIDFGKYTSGSGPSMAILASSTVTKFTAVLVLFFVASAF